MRTFNFSGLQTKLLFIFFADIIRKRHSANFLFGSFFETNGIVIQRLYIAIIKYNGIWQGKRYLSERIEAHSSGSSAASTQPRGDRLYSSGVKRTKAWFLRGSIWIATDRLLSASVGEFCKKKS